MEEALSLESEWRDRSDDGRELERQRRVGGKTQGARDKGKMIAEGSETSLICAVAAAKCANA